ncbi:MAG TPA: YetF domain-containing protein [Atopostipes sp.]|nr:YetF domain-containing protein [Atopostipes sp.]
MEKGKLNIKELKENYLDMEQLRAILRQHNCYSIHEVYYAILEINGSLTVIPKEKKEIPTILLVEEGAIKFKTLNGLGKSVEWLRTTLVEMGYSNIEEIIYCEWDETNQELLVGTYGQTINKSISLDD